MGALNSKPHLEKVKKYGRLAKEEGGTIHCGFGLTQINVASDLQNGYWFPPTVVTGLTNNSRQVFLNTFFSRNYIEDRVSSYFDQVS